MIKIAIIQFPGLNTEYETRREINRTGMKGEFFRWNENPSKLEAYNGYVIGGGFSYEDRGRAGVVASLDPIMNKIKEQAAKGKPVLGICNGAQILIEAGLVPGIEGQKLAMSLARNKRVKDGEVLGTGYYNVWVNMKCAVDPGRCVFTRNFKQDEVIRAPIAHGEGRFTTKITGLMEELKQNGQMAFRYCDKHGVIKDEFPINPNGSMFAIAAICNPAGNVMAIMPHLERENGTSEKLFTSMRDSIMAERISAQDKKRVHKLKSKPIDFLPLPSFQKQEKSLEMNVSLIITDNEAETFEMAVARMGFENVKLSRASHFEISYKGKMDLEKMMKKLIQSGVLLNTNKEFAIVKFPKQTLIFDAKKEKFLPQIKPEQNENVITCNLLVRENPDFSGMSKLSTIIHRLKMPEIMGLSTGTLWTISIPTKSKNVAEQTFKKLLNTHIFFNPHGQEAMLFS